MKINLLPREETPADEQSDVPEVQRFLEAKERLDSYRHRHPHVFEMIRALGSEYNDALEAAEKAIRPRCVSAGPFHLMRVETEYNAERIAERLGAIDFRAVGGVVEARYRLDKEKFEAAIAEGRVPPRVLEGAMVKTPYYHRIKKVYIP